MVFFEKKTDGTKVIFMVFFERKTDGTKENFKKANDK